MLINLHNVLKEVLENRLTKLGISKYELAKKMAMKRGMSKPTDISRLVSKCFTDPDKRRYTDLVDLIELMGGEVVVRWHSVEETVVSATRS